MSTLYRTGGLIVFLQHHFASRVVFTSFVERGDVKWHPDALIDGWFVQQLPNFGDDRNKGWCVFCGGPDETRDHAPSRVFLDEPYPKNLPVVPSCEICNGSFSLDEEYLACLIECARTGSVDQARAARTKVGRTLNRKGALAARLASARHESADGIIWRPEDERVRNVIVKLGRGHVAFEQNEPRVDEPTSVSILPLCVMTNAEREEFESSPDTGLWPEVGSRAMHRILVGAESEYPWMEVQPQRYRYMVSSGPFMVRVVIAEYLAAEVLWD